MTCRAWTKARALARTARFLRDETGAILVLWIMSLVAVVAFVALVFDMGRVQVTHGEFQSFADSVALAAAGELDGRVDAIARATAAAAEVADTNVYGGDGTLQGAGDYTLTFLSGLPEPDEDDETYNPELASTTSFETDVDAAARLVRVTITRFDFFDLGFLAATRALLGTGTTASAQVAVEAIAGFTMEACDIAPLMVCLPPNWHADANPGVGVNMRSRGNGASWTPGEFGFLTQGLLNTGGPCDAAKNKKDQDVCYLAASGPVTKCFARNGVDFETGEKDGNYAAAINARFDIYLKSMSDGASNPLYAPAPNRISGIKITKRTVKGNGAVDCTYDTAEDTVGLPPDTCLMNETCADGRFGDGTWDRRKYFGVNYLGESRYVLDDQGNVVTENGNKNGKPVVRTDFTDVDLSDWATELPSAMVAWFNANGLTPENATRWETYQAENEVSGTILPITGDSESHAETGRPQCNLTGGDEIDVYRRTVIVAGVVCTDDEGDSLYQGSANNVPVEEFIEIFLTNPAIEGATDDKFNLYGEVIRSVGKKGYGGAGDGGKFRDVVQLYR
ncbi:MAG: hypothetical protein KDK11_09590 [Maritimibacter sp.]|nr:hypothetical protein [Maritimibacter sp.]